MGVIKNMIRNWLEIDEPDSLRIQIEQLTNFEGQAFINDIWYRGDAAEISQLYEQIERDNRNKHFWASSPTSNSNIRKIHTGLPSMIVDSLADISTDDLSNIEVKDRQEEWNEIDDEIKLRDLANEAAKTVLTEGDGAFKVSIDTDISDNPIVEFYEGSRVDFEYERGRINAIIFKTKKIINKKDYVLKERYSKDGITFSLEDKDGKELDIREFPTLAKYKDVENPNKFIMAVPFMIYKSKKFKGRGKSIFDGKLDNFDAFDEVWSQWMLALRKGQLKEYIPDSLLPKNPETGEILRRNDFDVSFIMTESDMSEDAHNKIQTTQGNIQHEALLSTYITSLDQCLTGLISPSTLGIDTKKLENAEAQREKEKTTLYRRNQIVDKLNTVLEDLIEVIFKTKDTMNKKDIKDIDVTITFGGYANPSFEAQVETVGKASTSNIMSIEAQVEELWGDTKDEKWKQEEVKRIKEERGIVSMDEPAVAEDIELIEEQEVLEESENNNQEEK